MPELRRTARQATARPRGTRNHHAARKRHPTSFGRGNPGSRVPSDRKGGVTWAASDSHSGSTTNSLTCSASLPTGPSGPSQHDARIHPAGRRSERVWPPPALTEREVIALLESRRAPGVSRPRPCSGGSPAPAKPTRTRSLFLDGHATRSSGSRARTAARGRPVRLTQQRFRAARADNGGARR